MALNKVIEIGRLTAQPELKKTPKGTSITNFTIAVDRGYQAQGEERKADFIPCEAWRQTAEFICNYFGKGDNIAIVGELRVDPYTDKNGIKRTGFKVVIDETSFCGGKNNGSNANADTGGNTNSGGNSEEFFGIDNEDDLPF